jgi:AcrR family transcriptional regulator
MNREKSSYLLPSEELEDHEVRDQILSAATEHFSRYDYKKTTVSSFAKSIDFSELIYIM